MLGGGATRLNVSVPYRSSTLFSKRDHAPSLLLQHRGPSLPFAPRKLSHQITSAVVLDWKSAALVVPCGAALLFGVDGKQAFSKLKIPIKPMLRLRGGDFVYTRKEKDAMLYTLELLKQFDCKSIVFGALTMDGHIDQAFLNEITEAIGDQVLCFHKAIDYSTNILESCSALSTYDKVAEILSSGGAQTARGGVENLIEMKKLLRPDQKLIAAGKIRPENVSELHNLLNLEYYHGKKIINF